MRLIPLFLAAACVPAAAALADGPAAAPAPTTQLIAHGAQVYQERCAMCHEHPEGRTPNRAFLRQTRSPEFILRALTNGVMRENAREVSLDDKKAVATYLIGWAPGSASEVDPNANRCKAPPVRLDLDAPAWNGWGGKGIVNARFQPEPGFTAADVPRLKLKWTFAYPGGVANEPTVVGDRVFVSSMSGNVFALDAKTGCTHWTVDLGVPSRAMFTLGKLPSGKPVVFATEWHGTVFALDADTGVQIWKTTVDEHRAVRLTGSPTLHDGRLYVPVSSGEEAIAPDPKYACCTFRGSLVSLDAASGMVMWKSYSIEDAPKLLPDGHRYGPSGAAIWASPSVDAKRRLVYVGTGDDYSNPVTNASDAIIAYDTLTGKKRWTSQVVPGDTFIAGCEPRRHANCPTGDLGPDYDYGASPLLLSGPYGRDVLISATKGGVVYGMDPEKDGKILWQVKLGRGGLLGGVEWGMATNDKTIFVPIGDTATSSVATAEGEKGFPDKPGLHAIDVTGKEIWYAAAPKPVCSWTGACANAFTGAATVIPGVVFAGSWDGHERAYSAVDGKLLWDFDTGRSFDAVNGGKASGGSVDHGAQTVASGMLFVNSGGRQGHPGNALLVFSVDGK